ncbi:hypothetical protein FB451DRAFT_1270924 [Mycena latifolia]|nr:hypothetical protein FB451DRAFT_1270924 [Mycena latifolia]
MDGIRDTHVMTGTFSQLPTGTTYQTCHSSCYIFRPGPAPPLQLSMKPSVPCPAPSRSAQSKYDSYTLGGNLGSPFQNLWDVAAKYKGLQTGRTRRSRSHGPSRQILFRPLPCPGSLYKLSLASLPLSRVSWTTMQLSVVATLIFGFAALFVAAVPTPWAPPLDEVRQLSDAEARGCRLYSCL